MNTLTLIESIIKQIRELAEILTTKKDITFDEIETMMWKAVLEIGRTLIEGIIRIRGTCFTEKVIQNPSGEMKPPGYVTEPNGNGS